MATPKQGYRLQDGTRVPGTTTVIGRFKDSSGLMFWAFEQGKSGAAKLYDSAEKAADIGTAAHAMIEAHINNGGDNMAVMKALSDCKLPKGDEPRAINAFEQYLAWEKQTGIKLLSKYQEIQLVCPVHKYGGTPDAIGEIDGQVVLVDWKTSNGVYQDYLIQLAAYRHLIDNGVRMDTYEPLGMKITGGFHLLRFAKDFPDFGHHYFGNLDSAWRQFALFREAYEIDKELKRRAA